MIREIKVEADFQLIKHCRRKETKTSNKNPLLEMTTTCPDVAISPKIFTNIKTIIHGQTITSLLIMCRYRKFQRKP